MRIELSKNTEAVHTGLIKEIGELPDKFDRLQTEKKDRSDLSNQITYAGVVGDEKSLIYPIKKAMRQLKEDDVRSKNIVVHGLDINPSNTLSIKDRRQSVKMQVQDILHETTSGTAFEVSVDTESVQVLGKVTNSGKAPPVLVKLKSEKESMHVLRNANKLSKVRCFRAVFITADLGEDELKNRRELVTKLKEKITKFPEEHWIIRDGKVTSNGKHRLSQTVAFEEGVKSYEY